MKYNPLVSIVIPVYNGANYMRIAIDSALAQTYKNLEVIVVNDGSSDNGETDRIARSYGERIRYFTKQNGGVSTALNYGIENMNGEWFSWLSHDDVYKPEKIEKEIETLNRQLEMDKRLLAENCVVYCKSEQINAQGKVIMRRRYKTQERRDLNSILLSLSYMHVGGCTVLIPKKAFERIGLFDPARKNVQDKYLIYKLYLNNYTFLFTNEYLVQSRRHKEQTGNQVKATWQIEIDDLNCDFVNNLIERGYANDPEVLRALIIHFMKNRSIPTVELLKMRIKSIVSPVGYVFGVDVPMVFWKMYGIGRRTVRSIYRSVLAGQK